MKKNLIISLVFISLFSTFNIQNNNVSGQVVRSEKFQIPVSPRTTYNFNPGWKFVFGDSTGADQPGYNDTGWASISLPHTWNETDTYRSFISHSGGDQSEKMFGIGWYRKHFKLPAGTDGQKVFLQFDGMRQAGRFFLNGKPIGKYENGVTAVGFDITQFVKYGDQDNILAVKMDNSPDYKEEATDTPFEWNSKDFNPNFGGLNRNATLIIAGKIYQTLPLYENLKSTGIYIYPQAIDLKKKSADLKVEAEIVNETGDYASITLSAVVVDADGVVRAKLDGNTSDLVAGQSEVFTATGLLAGARFWDVKDPYLYKVYTMLTVNGKVADVCETLTGFRKTEFRGGAGTGGVWLNGRFIWLTGYAQRSANDWAGLGGAYPDWMHDFTLSMLRKSNGNYVRWMHVAPQLADVQACDRLGIVEVCPAGDKERLVTGRQWDQRVEAMRATMIFYRNNPSIFFWEAGNTIVTPEQMDQMVAMRKELDPYGGRTMGSEEMASDENTGCIYSFPNVVFVPGSIKAVARKSGKVVAQQKMQTAGEPKAIKLRLHTGPQGLQADGSDVALIDFMVVDAQGHRCPTDESRVDFDVTGPVVWRGGFNAGKLNTTNNFFLDTECGINRVAVRSTLIPGTITVTARREGLTSATLKIESKAVQITGGLMKDLPQTEK